MALPGPGDRDRRVGVAVGPEIHHSFAGPGAKPPKLLLVSPPPVLEAGCLAEIFAGAAEKSKRLAAVYADIASRHGIPVFDAGSVVASSQLDGVHYDATEHAKLGRALSGAVRGLFQGV